MIGGRDERRWRRRRRWKEGEREGEERKRERENCVAFLWSARLRLDLSFLLELAMLTYIHSGN